MGTRGDADGAGRFGPVDAGDLVGTASARLLAAGMPRLDRLTALRLLGLLADHADADLRVRRPLSDLASEFDLSPDDLPPALSALATIEVLHIDAERGTVTLAAPAAPARSSLRLESFLANVRRSMDEPSTDEPGTDEQGEVQPVPRNDVPAPLPEPAPLAALFGIPVAPQPVAPQPLDAQPVAPQPVAPQPLLIVGDGDPTTVRRGGAAALPASHEEDLVHAADDPLAFVTPIPLAAHRRPLRVATAALAAAAAALVLAVSPDASQRTTTQTLDGMAASADRPAEVDPDHGGTEVPRRPMRHRAGVGSKASDSATRTRGIEDPAGTRAAAQLDSLEPDADGPLVPQAPATTAAPGRGVAPERLDEVAPTIGPTVPPCESITPILDVVRMTTELGEGSVDRARPAPVVAVEGSAGNPFEWAVVIDVFEVRVDLADGTSRTVTSPAPILLAPGRSTTWTVEVPVGESTAEGAAVELVTWSRADGDPAAPCPP